MIDLTPLDGTMATVCLEYGIPYLGIALTDFHRACLLQRLARTTFDAFTAPGNELYVPMLCQLMVAKNEQQLPASGQEASPQAGAAAAARGSGTPDATAGDGGPESVAAAGNKPPTTPAKRKSEAQGAVKNARDRLLLRLQGAAAGTAAADDNGAAGDNVNEA